MNSTIRKLRPELEWIEDAGFLTFGPFRAMT